MNTGQTMLVIGAFALLSTLSLSMNSFMTNTQALGYEMDTNMDAISVAQTMMDEILSQDFDQHSVGRKMNNTASCTAADSFGVGKEPGESIALPESSKTSNFLSKTKLNDVDDYHLYKRAAWDPVMGWFSVVDTVQYLNEDNPNAVSAVKTWQKRITVVVTNPNMPKDNNGKVIPYMIRDVSVYRKYF